MNFLEKLDFMMLKLGINKSRLSVLSGVPYTTIDTFYKKGYENTKLSTIKKIAEALDVSMDYLIVDTITDEDYGKTNGFRFKSREMEQIKKYRLLDDCGKEVVDSVLDIEWRRCTKPAPAMTAEAGTAPPQPIKPEPQGSVSDDDRLVEIMAMDPADMTDEEFELYMKEFRRQAIKEKKVEENAGAS